VNETLTDRIRDLCARAVSAPEHELRAILAELQQALHEHSLQLREMASEKLRPPKKDRSQE